MYQSTILLSTVAVLPFAVGLAFPGPSATVAANADSAATGWTPRPTEGPFDKLSRRQTTFLSRDPGFCGWVEGDTSTVGCLSSGLTCALYTASNVAMAGCCASDDSQHCGWANSCVNYDAWTKKSCDAACQSNSFIRKCTDPTAQYCVTWTYPSDGVADYGCADYNSGVVTVVQSTEDTESSYEITLPTYTGLAVTGWDESEANGDATVDSSDPTATDTGGSNSNSNSNSNNAHKPKPTKKSTPVGLIAGAVVGGLVVIFLIIAAIIFFCVKKRKANALANNQAIIVAQQTSNPEYKPPVQQQHAPPAPVQSPPPQQQQNGYFVPLQDQKINYQTQVQVQEQGLQSPAISNPPTPAPAYVQPYYAAPNAPPIPSEGAAMQYPAREPTPGTYEVDAITAPKGRAGQQGNVFEIGGGK